MCTSAVASLTYSPLRLESKTLPTTLLSVLSHTSPLIFSPGLQDVRFPQEEAVAPSSPFLEEDECGKKDSWLVELAGERLMAATSCRSLREKPFTLSHPILPSVFLSQRLSLLAATFS